MRALDVRVGDAEVADESLGGLFADRGARRLPAEAAERQLAARAVADDRGLARNAIAVAILGIGIGENVGRMDLLDEAEPDHLGRDARRKRGRSAERPVARVLDAIARFAQRQRRTVTEPDGNLLIGNRHPAFAGKAGNREVLQLPAIDRIGEVQHPAVGDRRLLLRRLGLARQAQEHRGRIGIGFGRMAAAVLQVAALAGARVEQRPKPVRGLGRRGRGYPQLAEQAVAELEGAFFLEGQVGRGMREGVLVDALAGSAGAPLHQLEGFGPGEVRCRPGDGRDARQILGGQVVACRLQAGRHVAGNGEDARHQEDRGGDAGASRQPREGAGDSRRGRAARRSQVVPHALMS